MRTAVVTTTIHVPTVLTQYCRNLHDHGWDGDDVAMIVIGDRKTPVEVAALARQLSTDCGIPVDYWDVHRQHGYLRAHPGLDRLLPYNSIQRRNLAYVLAGQQGFDRIISIDDDNWPTDDDFLGGHSIVGTAASVTSISSSSGWFNTASMLATEPVRPLYHRGFPTSKRGLNEELTIGTTSGRIVVNAGLWTGVPDADAICHLDTPVRVTGMQPDSPERVAVAAKTMMVFNTQNTAFDRDLLPCLYLPAMGGSIGPMTVGRYDDIWMSMMAKPIIDHLGDVVTVGLPLVNQHRNEHDLFHDALIELPAMKLTNSLVSILDLLRLTAGDYSGCYRQAVGHLRRQVEIEPGEHDLDADQATYLVGLATEMETWVDIIDQMG